MDESTPARRPTNRRRWILAAIIGAALGVFVLVWFQPQALLFDRTVDETFPVVANTPTGRPTPGTTPSPAATSPAGAGEPVAVVEGVFGDRSHPTSGRVAVYELADGSRTLRIEDLSTDNGPDLYVYLTTASADAPAENLDDEAVDLGRLKGNRGDQNYAIPAGVDLAQYRTVVIWCDRFSVAFGTAPLTPA